MPRTAWTALSRLEGRYGRAAAPLGEVFSEYAVRRARLRVEVEWLIGLARLRLPELPELPAVSSPVPARVLLLSRERRVSVLLPTPLGPPPTVRVTGT